MLPKERRLTRRQFWQVHEQGITDHGSQMTVKYIRNDVGYSRWAVVTSAKISKKAVVRNSLRRRIYRALSTQRVARSVDAILFPKASMLNLSDAEISIELDQVVSKVLKLA